MCDSIAANTSAAAATTVSDRPSDPDNDTLAVAEQEEPASQLLSVCHHRQQCPYKRVKREPTTSPVSSSLLTVGTA